MDKPLQFPYPNTPRSNARKKGGLRGAEKQGKQCPRLRSCLTEWNVERETVARIGRRLDGGRPEPSDGYGSHERATQMAGFDRVRPAPW